MWPFRARTIEELKNEAFRKYIEMSGSFESSRRFRSVNSSQLRSWKSEFDGIVSVIESFVEKEQRFDYETFIPDIALRFQFMDSRSVNKAGWYGSYYAWRQGYKHY